MKSNRGFDLKGRTFCTVSAVLIFLASMPGFCANSAVQSAIQKAKAAQAQSVELSAAIMDTAVQKAPGDPDALAFFGLYAMQSAGTTKDFMKQGQWAGKAWQSLDKACTIDSTHVFARYFRGLLGANAPEFLGWLDKGAADLAYVHGRIKAGTAGLDKNDHIGVVTNLALACRKKKDTAGLKNALKELAGLAPDSEAGKNAWAELERMDRAEKAEPKAEAAVSMATGDWLKKAKALLDQGRMREALKAYDEAIRTDSTNLSLILAISDTVARATSIGYDRFIYDDQEARTLLAFGMARMADKAYALAPNNPGVRLRRGIIGAMMPFFVGKLEQSLVDLAWVSENAPSDSLKSEALFWLGYAYRRKGLNYWNTVASDHPDQDAFRNVLDAMAPAVRRIDADTLHKPVVVIEFALGFQDFLAPQTALWIADARGAHVKTVYVSGFSGFVKEKQVVLPVWAGQSKFEKADAVTSASIDAGQYAFAWDCTDASGKKVNPGKYTVRVETSFWPSSKHETASLPLEIGKSPSKAAAAAGKFIPFFQARYLVK
jgi:tetratricopeptide (TPR) repeat protein